MYKKLSGKERKMIEETTDGSQPPLPTGKAIRNMLVIAMIFVILVFIGYFIVYMGTRVK